MSGIFGRRERASEDASELVHLPVAVASPRDPRAAVASAGSAASAVKANSPLQRLFVVERVLGHGWVVACDRDSMPTVDGVVPAAGAEPHEAHQATLLPARLSPDECRRSIEALASRATLALKRARAADAFELEPLQPARYPFRLRYRRNRSGGIDFEALDAVTGKRAGGSLRAAIAAALIDADRAGATR
jgi:hypothetical protein